MNDCAQRRTARRARARWAVWEGAGKKKRWWGRGTELLNARCWETQRRRAKQEKRPAVGGWWGGQTGLF